MNKIAAVSQTRMELSTKRSIIALYVALSVVYLIIALILPPDKKPAVTPSLPPLLRFH